MPQTGKAGTEPSSTASSDAATWRTWLEPAHAQMTSMQQSPCEELEGTKTEAAEAGGQVTCKAVVEPTCKARSRPAREHRPRPFKRGDWVQTVKESRGWEYEDGHLVPVSTIPSWRFGQFTGSPWHLNLIDRSTPDELDGNGHVIMCSDGDMWVVHVSNMARARKPRELELPSGSGIKPA